MTEGLLGKLSPETPHLLISLFLVPVRLKCLAFPRCAPLRFLLPMGQEFESPLPQMPPNDPSPLRVWIFRVISVVDDGMKER